MCLCSGAPDRVWRSFRLRHPGGPDLDYTLAFPGQPEGYGVYGVTEYADGNRDATLYLTINAQTLCLTAPLSET